MLVVIDVLFIFCFPRGELCNSNISNFNSSYTAWKVACHFAHCPANKAIGYETKSSDMIGGYDGYVTFQAVCHLLGCR